MQIRSPFKGSSMIHFLGESGKIFRRNRRYHLGSGRMEDTPKYYSLMKRYFSLEPSNTKGPSPG